MQVVRLVVTKWERWCEIQWSVTGHTQGHTGTEVWRGGQEGYTPLHLAAQRGYLEIADRLIKAKCDIDRVKEVGQTRTQMLCWGRT